MLKKLCVILCGIYVYVANAFASAPIVNVKYIHDAINGRWGITIPYNSSLENDRVAANMHYLLTCVDVANKKLNFSETNYGTGAYATRYAANKVVADRAIETLIHNGGASFYIRARTNNFKFTINVMGDFTIDWGDGNTENLSHKSVQTRVFEHKYKGNAERIITISGRATGYSASTTDATITFENNVKPITEVGGQMGRVFPTLTDGSQPRFYRTFYGQTQLTKINGALFDGLVGAPTTNMFFMTFYGCTGLTDIPYGIFGNLYGDLSTNSFYRTFYGCTGLTGDSAKVSNGQFLYQVWPNATTNQVGYMYYNATNLNDYATIPSGWR